jgi:FkbM family methyltransferase
MNVFVDPRFDRTYEQFPLVLVDVGARGGLRPNWASAKRHLRLIGFEPDAREHRRLLERADAEPTTTYFGVALHNQRGPMRLNVARDAGLTSIFEPNRPFLDAFPEAGRFDTVASAEVEADTLDHVLAAHDVANIDFIKADTQGSELFVLEGARQALASLVLGVEVEVEFASIYKQQPLFADVDRFLRDLGFALFDLRPCCWKRAAGQAVGGPRGQIIWADALYLKTPSALDASLASAAPEAAKSKVLKAISIAVLYGYYDFALELCASAAHRITPEDRAVIERRLRSVARPGDALPNFPGRRLFAAGFHRLWKMCRPAATGWSISDPELGNLR